MSVKFVSAKTQSPDRPEALSSLSLLSEAGQRGVRPQRRDVSEGQNDPSPYDTALYIIEYGIPSYRAKLGVKRGVWILIVPQERD